jgi:hypothetical protein
VLLLAAFLPGSSTGYIADSLYYGPFNGMQLSGWYELVSE